MIQDAAMLELNEPEQIDYENYDEGGPKSFSPPAEGIYVGKVPVIRDNGTLIIDETNSFGKTQKGDLKVSVDPIEIVAPGKPENGYKVRFTEFSAKKYVNRMASPMVDFLRACGSPARPKNNAELRAALKMVSGKTFKFSLQWEARDKGAGTRVQGAENFPKGTDGKPLPYITSEHEVDDQNRAKRYWANARIRYVVNPNQK